jgi:hypothetical protein
MIKGISVVASDAIVTVFVRLPRVSKKHVPVVVDVTTNYDFTALRCADAGKPETPRAVIATVITTSLETTRRHGRPDKPTGLPPFRDEPRVRGSAKKFMAAGLPSNAPT